MSLFNLKELSKHEYKESKSCSNCVFGRKRLGMNCLHVNWCIYHESQINHIFVCNKFEKC